MITIRVRTNLGTQRVQVAATETKVSDLIEAIRHKLNISTSDDSPLVISRDLPGINRLMNVESFVVEDEGLKNGDEVFVVGKFEEVVVKTPYVNDNHEVIQAGKSLKMIEPPPSLEPSPTATTSSGAVTASAPTSAPVPAAAAAPIVPTFGNNFNTAQPPPTSTTPSVSAANSHLSSTTSTAKQTTSSKVNNSSVQQDATNVPSTTSAKVNNQHEKADDFAYIPDEAFEDDVRAPDQVRQMQLLQDPTMALSEEDYQKIEKYRKELRAMGMNEYAVEQEVLDMTDELVARSVHTRMQNEDTMTNGGFGMTSLEELEELLNRSKARNAQVKRLTHQHTQQLLQRNLAATESDANAALLNRNLAKKYDLTGTSGKKAATSSAASSNSGTSGKPSVSSSSNATKLQSTGQRVLSDFYSSNSQSNVAPPSSSSTASLPRDPSTASLQTSMPPTPTEEVRNSRTDLSANAPRLSLQSTGYRDFSEFRNEASGSQKKDSAASSTSRGVASSSTTNARSTNGTVTASTSGGVSSSSRGSSASSSNTGPSSSAVSSAYSNTHVRMKESLYDRPTASTRPTATTGTGIGASNRSSAVAATTSSSSRTAPSSTTAATSATSSASTTRANPFYKGGVKPRAAPVSTSVNSSGARISSGIDDEEAEFQLALALSLAEQQEPDLSYEPPRRSETPVLDDDEARQLQEDLDAIAAAELQEEEDSRIAEELDAVYPVPQVLRPSRGSDVNRSNISSREGLLGKRPAPASTSASSSVDEADSLSKVLRDMEARTRALREFLEEDIPLTPALDASVTSSVDDDLLQMAINRSAADTGLGGRSQPRSAQHSQPENLPYYDEDDEMLARAIQDSLNNI